jgi:hypothetical protein
LQLINHIDGSRADAYIVTHYKTIGRPPSQSRPSRWGDVYEHADEGLLHAKIQPPTYPARYAYAEPQTGGEAFIPKYGDYNRSMGIIAAAAGWYGAHVVPGGGRSSGSSAIQIAVFGADDAGKAMVNMLRFEIYQGGGSPDVVLRPRGSISAVR